MPNSTYRAIVLRSVRYGEHDRMLTLFTYEKGKISASAKGAQSAKSRFLALSQPFTVSELVLSESKSRYLSSGELLNGFFGIGRDIMKVSAATYICQLTEQLMLDEEPDESVFRLLYFSLGLIEKSDETRSAMLAMAFALKLMGLSGMAPALDGCTECGEEKDFYRFDYREGGLLCDMCAKDTDMPVLRRSEAALLKDLLYMNMNELNGIPLPDAATVKYLFRTVNNYIIYMSGQSAKSFEMFSSLL